MTDLVGRLRAAMAVDHWDPPWWWDSPEKTFGYDIGSPASLLAEAADELETLRSIVHDLAASDPGAVTENYGDPYCTLCDGEDRQHEDDCPWRRAVEFASRSGEQPPVHATPGNRDMGGRHHGRRRRRVSDEAREALEAWNRQDRSLLEHANQLAAALRSEMKRYWRARGDVVEVASMDIDDFSGQASTATGDEGHG